MAANAAAILAALAITGWPRAPFTPGSPGGWVLSTAAAGGLLLAALLSRRATTVSLLLGQVTAAVLVTGICVRASGADRRGLPSASASAWTFGMEGFFALLFLYYAGYDMVLPYDNDGLFAVAAAALAVAGVVAQWGARALAGRVESGPRAPQRPPSGTWLPAALGVVLLAAPLSTFAPRARPAVPEGFPVRVMSYNLHFGFDVTGWSDLEGIARDIESARVDVVGLQEVNRGWYVNGASDMLAWLARRLNMPHVAFGPASDPLWGNAVLSRHPIIASGVVPLPREGAPLQRSYLWTMIDLGREQTLQVIDTHLHQISGFEGERIRLLQVDKLLQAWGGAPVTVLMGDFNAQPDSPVVARLQAAGLVDAWQAAGGSPADELTAPSADPRARIDYIWYSPDLRVDDFRATTSTASDHRGIVVTLSR